MNIREVTRKISGIRKNERVFFVNDVFYSVTPLKGNQYKIFSAYRGSDSQFGDDHKDALEKHLSVNELKEVV